MSLPDHRKSYYKDEVYPRYWDAMHRSSEEFEKKIVYVSAGALVLSVTFLDKIIVYADSTCKLLLNLSWGLLLAAICLNLISQLVAQRLIRKNTSEVQELIGGRLDEKTHIARVKSRNKTLNKINWVTGCSFLAGIILMVVYIVINLNA